MSWSPDFGSFRRWSLSARISRHLWVGSRGSGGFPGWVFSCSSKRQLSLIYVDTFWSFFCQFLDLLGGFNPTHLKNMRKSNWKYSSPKFQGEHKQCLSCHQLYTSSFCWDFTCWSRSHCWVWNSPSKNLQTYRARKLTHPYGNTENHFKSKVPTDKGDDC